MQQVVEKDVAAHAEGYARTAAAVASELVVVAKRRSLQGGQIAGNALQTGVKSAGIFLRQAALIAAESSLVISKQFMTALNRVLRDLQASEALKVRRPEDVLSFESSLASLRRVFALDALGDELRALPWPAVTASAFLSLRALSALSDIADTLLHELVCGTSLLARSAGLMLALPGWLAVWHFRSLFLQEFRSIPFNAQGQVQAGGAATVRLAQALRVARCLPPVFWLSVAMSGAIATQLARILGKRGFHVVLRTRARGLVLAAVAGAVVTSEPGKKIASKSVAAIVDKAGRMSHVASLSSGAPSEGDLVQVLEVDS